MSRRQRVVFDAIGSFTQQKRTKNSRLRSFSQQFSDSIAFAYVASKIESCRNIQYLNSLYNINMYTTFTTLCATAHNTLTVTYAWNPCLFIRLLGPHGLRSAPRAVIFARFHHESQECNRRRGTAVLACSWKTHPEGSRRARWEAGRGMPPPCMGGATMSIQAAEQHAQAAAQYGHAACQYQEAAAHHQVGQYAKAAQHVQTARAHHAQATAHACAAAIS
jgi:hypothetical protein